MNEPVLWGIRAGRYGEGDEAFLQSSRVAIGWKLIGDLSRLQPNREAFKSALSNAYPADKPGSIPTNAGQLFRFVHEAKVGDFIAYPSKVDHKIHLGRVVGEYEYVPDFHSLFCNTREVKWLTAIPRTRLSQGALYEIGSALSFFQVRNYADEFWAVIENRQIVVEVDSDETIGEVFEDTAESTRDFIIKTLAQKLKGHPFADFVAHL